MLTEANIDVKLMNRGHRSAVLSFSSIVRLLDEFKAHYEYGRLEVGD